MQTLIARLMGPTWFPPGADRSQVGPMLTPWTLLSRNIVVSIAFIRIECIYFICLTENLPMVKSSPPPLPTKNKSMKIEIYPQLTNAWRYYPLKMISDLSLKKIVIILLQTKEHTCNNCPRLFPRGNRLMSPTTLQINTSH